MRTFTLMEGGPGEGTRIPRQGLPAVGGPLTTVGRPCPVRHNSRGQAGAWSRAHELSGTPKKGGVRPESDWEGQLLEKWVCS